jgi:predicted ribosomally synthesized peptide with nif11-like leader
MSQQALQAFIDAVRKDPALQDTLSTTTAADVDVVAGWAREAGFDVVSRDFVEFGDGALVEYEDEDYFLKSTWWTLA